MSYGPSPGFAFSVTCELHYNTVGRMQSTLTAFHSNRSSIPTVARAICQSLSPPPNFKFLARAQKGSGNETSSYLRSEGRETKVLAFLLAETYTLHSSHCTLWLSRGSLSRAPGLSPWVSSIVAIPRPKQYISS